MTETTLLLENCLQRLKAGDLQARDELIARASRRLFILTERMLRHYQRVSRWEQADDVFQQAVIRLYRCLAEVVPPTLEDFFRLGTLQLRRELNTMARHYFGKQGPVGNHDHYANNGRKSLESIRYSEPADTTFNPEKISLWTEFHDAADQLPEREKQVFDLIWYHGLNQSEAAEILQISERQLRRYWHSARIRLNQQLGHSGPNA